MMIRSVMTSAYHLLQNVEVLHEYVPQKLQGVHSATHRYVVTNQMYRAG